jgi:hypothetical protein
MKSDKFPGWVKYLVVLVLIVLLIIIDYQLVRLAPSKSVNAFKLDGYDIVFALVNAFIPSLIAYLTAGIFLRFSETKERQEELKDFVVTPLLEAIEKEQCRIFSVPEKIDWENLFTGATSIYILAQSWPGWHKAVRKQLPSFLDRGGKIFLMLHATDAPTNKFAAERLAPGANMNEKINATVADLRQSIKDNHKNPDQHLRVIYIQHMNWYCAAYSRPNSQLLLSLYAHKHYADLPPSFLVGKNDFLELVEWFEREWDSLLPLTATPDCKLNT